MLKREQISTTALTVRRFYIHFCDTGSNEKQPAPERLTLLSTTAVQIQAHLHAQGMEMLIWTILPRRRLHGWT